jgi:hypothetical protein
MTSATQILLSWNDVLTYFERHRPRAFNYFYDFHSVLGLEEDDISPFDRLDDIMSNGGDYDALVREIEDSIALEGIVSTISEVVFEDEEVIVLP